MNSILLSYSAAVYAMTVSSAIPRGSFYCQFVLDNGSKKQIHALCEQLPAGAYDLYTIHRQLERLNVFQKHGASYEYLSSDGQVHVVLSEQKGEMLHSMKVNAALSLQEHTPIASFEAAHSVAEFSRKGAVWTASANMSLLASHMPAFQKLIKIFYQPSSNADFKYVLGGRSPEQTRTLTSIMPLVLQAQKSILEMEEAEKLVVPPGKEKSKRFSKKKKTEDESQETHSSIVAEILPAGEVLVREVKNSPENSIDFQESTEYSLALTEDPQNKPD